MNHHEKSMEGGASTISMTPGPTTISQTPKALDHDRNSLPNAKYMERDPKVVEVHLDQDVSSFPLKLNSSNLE